MKKHLKAVAVILLLMVVTGGFVQAQTTPSTTNSTPFANEQSRVLGEVLLIDLTTGQVTLKTAQGAQVVIESDEKTIYRRVPAGEKTLDKAVTINLADISVGDRVIARGYTTETSKPLRARSVVVVDHKEIAQKKERDRAAWLNRGVEGVVTAIKPEANEVTLLTKISTVATSLTIAASGSPIRRYAPDSIKYSDAIPSTINEVKVGDRLRALGDKSSDGARFTAEEIVFGSIRTLGGFVTEVNVASGEIKINDIPTKQTFTIVVRNDSMLRRLSPTLAKQLGEVPTGNSAESNSGRRTVDLQQSIEQQSPITIADLKVGDAVLASTTVGATPSRVSAIILAAGVESFLKQYLQQPKGGDFNLSLGLPSGITP